MLPLAAHGDGTTTVNGFNVNTRVLRRSLTPSRALPYSSRMSGPTWLTMPRLGAMFFGSLAVFMWVANRQPAVTATYVISSTSNSLARPRLYKHLIDIERTTGYADRIELTATFNTPVHVFASWLHAPSSAHRLSCDVIPTGTTCRLGPMDARGQYVIALTTDSGEPPVLTAAGIQLLSPADIASREVASNVTCIFAVAAVLLLALSSVVVSPTTPRAWVLGQDDFKV
jgi:hypothetical protein